MPFLVLAYLGSVVYLVWMTLRLGLAVPACIAEEKTAVEAMRRSARLTRGSMGRIFLVMLVVYAIGAAAIMVLEMVGFAVFAVVGLIASAMHVHLPQGVAVAGFGTLVIGVFAAFLLFMTLNWASYAVAFAVLYDDQRNRINGATRPAMSGGAA
jgi:membrane-anchored glycerophosphoryl diester phosphodiesterase (GDPDase)